MNCLLRWSAAYFGDSALHLWIRQTQDIHPMSVPYLPTVLDAGQASNHHWVNYLVFAVNTRRGAVSAAVVYASVAYTGVAYTAVVYVSVAYTAVVYVSGVHCCSVRFWAYTAVVYVLSMTTRYPIVYNPCKTQASATWTFNNTRSTRACTYRFQIWNDKNISMFF